MNNIYKKIFYLIYVCLAILFIIHLFVDMSYIGIIASLIFWSITIIMLLSDRWKK